MNQDFHFYEPSKGHGLAHDPFNAIIGPRPIGWISTRDTTGRLNLAPFSFFNAFAYRPPIIGFASSGAKDTLRNAQETGEFVWNLATMSLAQQMNASSASVPHDVSEFDWFVARFDRRIGPIGPGAGPLCVRKSTGQMMCVPSTHL